MAVIAIVRFAFDLLAGDVEGGSVANILMRVVAVPAVLFACGFVVAAILDWYGRYLRKRHSE